MGYFNFVNGSTALNDTNLNAMQKGLMQLIFPIGSTYITQDNTNPNSILGFGTWERLKGKVCVGIDENDNDFNTIGKIGGNKVSQELNSGIAGMGLTSDGTKGYEDRTIIRKTAIGGSAERNAQISLLQPYEVVGYMWIRRS